MGLNFKNDFEISEKLTEMNCSLFLCKKNSGYKCKMQNGRKGQKGTEESY